MTADTAVLVKTVLVLAGLLAILSMCGAGWVLRWTIGLALGGLLVVAALLVLLALL